MRTIGSAEAAKGAVITAAAAAANSHLRIYSSKMLPKDQTSSGFVAVTLTLNRTPSKCHEIKLRRDAAFEAASTSAGRIAKRKNNAAAAGAAAVQIYAKFISTALGTSRPNAPMPRNRQKVPHPKGAAL
ncbi:MAG: hypothetical protein K9G60_01785 [Pseudolabrys sp.]|nr:hypothetical protein [Pseudolabrys sp.]